MHHGGITTQAIDSTTSHALYRARQSHHRHPHISLRQLVGRQSTQRHMQSTCCAADIHGGSPPSLPSPAPLSLCSDRTPSLLPTRLPTFPRMWIPSTEYYLQGSGRHGSSRPDVASGTVCRARTAGTCILRDAREACCDRLPAGAPGRYAVFSVAVATRLRRRRSRRDAWCGTMLSCSLSTPLALSVKVRRATTFS